MNKKNIPEIRFSGFDDEWTQIFVKDLFLLSAEGGTPSTKIKENYENGSIPFVKIEDTTNKYIYNTKTRITEEGLNNSSAWLIPKNSIIFTNGATIGNISINKIPVSTKQGIMGLILKNNFDLEYIYYSLSTDTFSEKVWDKVAIGTFPWITTKNFNNLNFNYSSNSFEQNKIGLFLKNIDDLISKTEKQYNYFKNIKESLLNKMFPNGYSDFPEIRFDGFEEKWNFYLLKDICERFDNLRIPIAENKRVWGKTPYYGANGIQGFVKGYTHDGENILVAEDGVNDINNYSINYVEGKIWVNNHAHVIKSKIGYNNYFISIVLKTSNWKNILVGGDRHKLNSQQLMNLELSVPLTFEQTKIGSFFKNLDDLIALIKQKHEKLKNIKNALLDKMFC